MIKCIEKYLPELQQHQEKLDHLFSVEIYGENCDFIEKYSEIVTKYNTSLRNVFDELCEELKDINNKETMRTVFAPTKNRDLFFDEYNPYHFLKMVGLTGSFNRNYHKKFLKEKEEN